MDLKQGMCKFRMLYGRSTNDLQKRADSVRQLIHTHGDNPSQFAMSEGKKFLVEVERWKADCLEQRIGNARRNRDKDVWIALKQALEATDDNAAILAVMQLKGFGSSTDSETGQRRAKVATAVLRFLFPEKWGVVDWRVAAITGILKKSSRNVDRAISLAREHSARELRNLYDIIDERGACEINEEFRALSKQYPDLLPRVADAEMALFGISLAAWPT